MRVVVLGAGISGHTAALILRKKLSKEHEVVVVSPNSNWNWIPSNIWVGVGTMSKKNVIFPLKPVYDKQKIFFHQARATEIYPNGDMNGGPFVIAESTQTDLLGEKIKIEYDYLINATGPKLNFSATPGLGPDHHQTVSVCTADHAVEAAEKLNQLINEMQKGERKTFVVGMGHGMCTCEGAAFEYTFNLEFELNRHGVRDKAKIIYLTNESQLGDFGVGGLQIKMGGYITPGKVFSESLFAEKDIDWILGAHVRKIEKNLIEYEDLTGGIFTQNFDFAMLLPPFTGVPMRVFNKNKEDISAELFNAGGFMKVDADYNPKPYSEWKASDWPKTYQTKFKNLFSIGIAFAPPHQISEPKKNPNGTVITPAPPRTGMPSAIMGKIVAQSIVEMIKDKSEIPKYEASMSEIGAACVASAGDSFFKGSAVSMTMYPIVQNYEKYPNVGRSLKYTTGEIGLAGHWIKKLLHYAFIYKAKAKPFWWIIPE